MQNKLWSRNWHLGLFFTLSTTERQTQEYLCSLTAAGTQWPQGAGRCSYFRQKWELSPALLCFWKYCISWMLFWEQSKSLLCLGKGKQQHSFDWTQLFSEAFVSKSCPQCLICTNRQGNFLVNAGCFGVLLWSRMEWSLKGKAQNLLEATHWKEFEADAPGNVI